ncbi:MAG: hypothetical protein MJZ74_01910 [Muribaculaceae bacterium]|nr:hypothetical protein [Muribaculaceae bacterium]
MHQFKQWWQKPLLEGHIFESVSLQFLKQEIANFNPKDIEATRNAFAVLVYPSRASGCCISNGVGVGCSISGKAFGDAFVSIDNDIVPRFLLVFQKGREKRCFLL